MNSGFISLVDNKELSNIEAKIFINDKEFKFNSFVNNFRDALFKILAPSEVVQLKNLNNGNITYTSNVLRVDTAENDLTKGIIIGDTEGPDSANPGIGKIASLTDYNLQKPIARGSAPNIKYDAMPTQVVLSEVGGSTTLTISRRFYILQTLSINEIGLVASTIHGSASATSTLICRDIIPRQTFPTDSVIKISLQFRLTNNNGFLVNFLKILYSYFTNTSINITDINGTSVTHNFIGESLYWAMKITESIKPIYPEQVKIEDVIPISGTYNKIGKTDTSNIVTYITFKSSFDNTTTNTYTIRELATIFKKTISGVEREFLVNLIKVNQPSIGNIATNQEKGSNVTGIVLPPDKLYRANHSIGFKKDLTDITTEQ